MKIEFNKMSGAGNDFVVIDNRYAIIKNNADFARKVCNRHWSIGADGLILLEPSGKAAYRMMYYNADGSYGGMCGNGGRCIAMFAYLKNIANSNHSFEALDHIYSVAIENDSVSISMTDPKSLQMNKYLYTGKKRIPYHSIDTGAPHIVININEISSDKDFEGFDVHRWGKLLRWHKKFKPAGTNVNFIKLFDDNIIHLRTYERGVEAETLACGTGSIASAIVACKKWKLNKPVKVIPTSNVPLTVNFDEVNKNIRNIKLTGPAAITFTGSLDG